MSFGNRDCAVGMINEANPFPLPLECRANGDQHKASRSSSSAQWIVAAHYWHLTNGGDHESNLRESEKK